MENCTLHFSCLVWISGSTLWAHWCYHCLSGPEKCAVRDILNIFRHFDFLRLHQTPKTCQTLLQETLGNKLVCEAWKIWVSHQLCHSWVLKKVKTDAEKLKAVTDWLVPRASCKQLQWFLRFTNFYQWSMLQPDCLTDKCFPLSRQLPKCQTNYLLHFHNLLL